MAEIAVHSTLRTPVPALVGALLLGKIKKHVLGTKYELSVVFVGDARSKTLNKKYRKKNKPTNVLAFPLNKTSGEIVINVPLARRECSRFGTNAGKHILYLFIHGCLHLKGYEHGGTMECEEDRTRTRFGV